MAHRARTMVLPGLLALAVLSALAWSVADRPPVRVRAIVEALPSKLQQMHMRAGEALAAGFQRAPVAVIGVAVALALPGLGLLALAGRGLRRWGRRRRAVRALAGGPPGHGPAPGRARAAWLSVEGRPGHALPATVELHRIGRDADNDITITGPAISALHALILRTPEAEYVLIDVSGTQGGGLTVNGARPTAAPLRDGDRIALGNQRLVFRRPDPGPGRPPPTLH